MAIPSTFAVKTIFCKLTCVWYCKIKILDSQVTRKHFEFYIRLLLKTNQKTLVIGDNLRTDIKGANNMNLDSLFITSGVHKSKTINENMMEELLVEHKVSANYFQKELTACLFRQLYQWLQKLEN